MNLGAMDREKLPRRALLDTSACIYTFRGRRKDPRTRDHKDFFDAMLESGRDLLIAAPSIAEFQRKYETPIPRALGVEVVAFDHEAANTLARDFPPFVFQEVQRETAAPATCVKYDALIVACAVRHNADCIITTDNWMVRVAGKVGLKAAAAGDFREDQTKMPWR